MKTKIKKQYIAIFFLLFTTASVQSSEPLFIQEPLQESSIEPLLENGNTNQECVIDESFIEQIILKNKNSILEQENNTLRISLTNTHKKLQEMTIAATQLAHKLILMNKEIYSTPEELNNRIKDIVRAELLSASIFLDLKNADKQVNVQTTNENSYNKN